MKVSIPGLTILVAISATVACASVPPSPLPGVRGIWISAFEQSEFRPCDLTTHGAVWAALDTSVSSDIWRRVPSRSPLTDEDTIYVRWAGVLSPPRDPRARIGGAYGHGGAYTHEFRVTTLYEARRAAPGDCGIHPSASRPGS
jgi:hypothetical protein